MHLQVVTTALSVSCFLHLSELQRSVKSMVMEHQGKVAIEVMSSEELLFGEQGSQV